MAPLFLDYFTYYWPAIIACLGLAFVAPAILKTRGPGSALLAALLAWGIAALLAWARPHLPLPGAQHSALVGQDVLIDFAWYGLWIGLTVGAVLGSARRGWSSSAQTAIASIVAVVCPPGLTLGLLVAACYIGGECL